MTTHQLIDEFAARTGMSKREAESALLIFTGIVTENMAKGEKTSIVRFGTFDLGKRAARRGVDPRTGSEIHIPEMAMPRFRAGNGLKGAVRQHIAVGR